MASNGKIKAILIRLDSESQFLMLTDKEAGKLIKALLHYGNTGEKIGECSRATQMAFAALKAVIDDYSAAYADKCAKRKAAIEKRWQMQKEEQQENTNEYNCIQMNTNEYNCILNKSKVNQSKVKENISLTSNDNIISHTPHARTHEGLTDFIEEAKTDQSYIEMLSMALHQPPDRVCALLSEFALECRAKEKAHTSRRDFRSHFFDWARIQTEKAAKRPPKQSSSEPTDINDLWK